MGDGGLGAVVGAVQIHLQNGVPPFVGELVHMLALVGAYVDARVVHQHVDAVALGGNAIHGGGHGLAVGDIEFVPVGVVALGAQSLGGGHGALQVAHGYGGSVLGKAAGHGGAQSSRGARDDYGFVLKGDFHIYNHSFRLRKLPFLWNWGWFCGAKSLSLR